MRMTEWFTALEGTSAGHQIALSLALGSALLHAIFGALQKGNHDPWLSRGAIDISYGLIAVPFVLFVVPWPEPHMWMIFAITFVIHCFYKYMQAMAYERGAYTVVYPVVRGTGPLFAIIGAWLLFGERFNAVQWLGVAVLLSGIYGLALYNLRNLTVGRDTLKMALVLAVILAAQGEGRAVIEPGYRVGNMSRRILTMIAGTDALSVSEKIQACNLLMHFTSEDTRKLARKLAESLMHHAA
jgi:multidrug transporter EmrE-like cation transporter